MGWVAAKQSRHNKGYRWNCKTGKMFIQSVLPENGYMNLTGSSVPDKMRKVAKENNKSWNNAKVFASYNRNCRQK